MKKTILILFLCIIFILGATGCSNRNNKEQKKKPPLKNQISKEQKNKLSLKDQISKEHYYERKIICSSMNTDVIDLNINLFVTKNKAYQINYYKLYSNDENCREISINNLNGDIIMFSDWASFFTNNNVYRFNENEKVYNKEEGNETAYNLNKLFSSMGANIIYNEVKDGYLVSIDNKLKLIKLNTDLSIKETLDIKITLDENEQILSINSYFVKTNKAYYSIKRHKVNKELCEKYADVKCQYDLVLKKDKALTDNYNDILFAGEYIFDKNKNVYHYNKSSSRISSASKS